MRVAFLVLVVGCRETPSELPASRVVACLKPDTVWVHGSFSRGKDSTRMIFPNCF